MRYTNLELLKKVSRAINSDEVDALDETLESLDILDIMERTLDDICSRRHWEFMKDKVAQAIAGSHVVELTIPPAVVRMQQLRYNTSAGWKTLTYMEPDLFMQRLQTTGDNTDTVTINGVEIYPRNDADPQYFTSFNEQTVVLDSYNSSVDASGVDYTKSYIAGIVKPTFDFDELTSASVYQDIPELMFNYWLWETIAVASAELRQMDSQRAERSARRAYIRLLSLEPVTNDDGNAPVSYGRTKPSSMRKIRRV